MLVIRGKTCEPLISAMKSHAKGYLSCRGGAVDEAMLMQAFANISPSENCRVDKSVPEAGLPGPRWSRDVGGQNSRSVQMSPGILDAKERQQLQYKDDYRTAISPDGLAED
ncbi:hypothetical protein PCL_03062 [Purpureocillium lilacinum]|uniref:Uncharacterized protein n=1 Tax=Purpureocillium lilacinum TaxID=33203 RepID=A0A2U3DYH9_PURLI|nr:hypothetical protein Purlil1_501 [Purpureocillium lilacinum]PWI67294.1 hypothetical protein PCL_03062 [Purpureocillium lilacinum]